MRRTTNEITTVDAHVPVELLKHAKRMRHFPTKAEKVLWKLLRSQNLNDWKFRRQHPIADSFILDFYCVETGVAIEVDGAIHQDPEQKAYDDNRTRILSEYGVKIIRFTNHEVISNALEVLERIRAFSNSVR